MKKVKVMMMTLMMCLFTSISFSQDTKEKQLSDAEILSTKSGILIEKQFIDIGKCKTVEIKVLKIKDLSNNNTISALRLEYQYVSSYSKDTKIVSLDKNEIDDLIKTINNLQTNIFITKPNVYTEVYYKSKTDFECGAYYHINNGIWKPYIQLRKYDSNSIIFLNIEELSTFLLLIEQAKLKM